MVVKINSAERKFLVDSCCAHHKLDEMSSFWDFLRRELVSHFPFSVLAVAFSMMVTSVIVNVIQDVKSNLFLFHLFHYLHIFFATTGTMVSFRKYSNSAIGGIFAGILIPLFFCTFSDAILPYVGSVLIFNGIIQFHWCFIDHFASILPFFVVGIINGWVLSSQKNNQKMSTSLNFHFWHIFSSALASLFYLIAYGVFDWDSNLGIVFLFLIGVVLIPCSFSDIILPLCFAKASKRKRREGIGFGWLLWTMTGRRQK